MKLILFFDDLFLAGLDGIKREWETPEFLGEVTNPDLAFSTVIYDPSQKCFRAWGKRVDCESDVAKLYESNDGINWHETNTSFKLYPSQQFYEQNWFYDPFDPNPAQRYKMTYWPYEGNTYGGRGVLNVSADGKKWTVKSEYVWSPKDGNGCDTNSNIYFNPFTQMWNIVCRKHHADRRVVIVQSKDLESWSPPRIVLQADSLDDELTEFYGMETLFYENEYFIGALQIFVPSRHECGEKAEVIKMSGKVYPELTYSYDGEYWQRSARKPLIPLNKAGDSPSSVLAPNSINQASDQKIYFHAVAEDRDHGFESGKVMTQKVFSMRRDGFVALTPRGGHGEITTKVLVPEGEELSLNYIAPSGQILVQITDYAEKPIPGYTYEDVISIKGDSTNQVVKWHDNKKLEELKGQQIRIQIKLIDAKLYAIRLKSKIASVYTKTPIERF